MTKAKFFEYALVVGLMVLGLIFLGVAVCADFDPERGVAGCALLVSARYLS